MDTGMRAFAEQKIAKPAETKQLDGIHTGNAIEIRVKMWGQYLTEW